MLLSISNGLVIAMGLGVVFFGLICIIFLIWLLGKIIGVLVKDKPGESITPPLPAAPAAWRVLPSRTARAAASARRGGGSSPATPYYIYAREEVGRQ